MQIIEIECMPYILNNVQENMIDVSDFGLSWVSILDHDRGWCVVDLASFSQLVFLLEQQVLEKYA